MRKIALYSSVITLFVAFANCPVTTRHNINYVLRQKKVPLYEKATCFLARHLETQRKEQEILDGVSGEEERVLTLFHWTVENIRPPPKGMPVVDDHPLHIIIRGYGAEDQQAEVLALLANYAGYPSGVQRLKPEGGATEIRMTLIKMNHRTFVFDVARNILFRDASGRLVHLTRLQSDPNLVQEATGRIKVGGQNYERFLRKLDEKKVSFYRMEMQKPWPRLKLAFCRNILLKATCF